MATSRDQITSPNASTTRARIEMTRVQFPTTSPHNAKPPRAGIVPYNLREPVVTHPLPFTAPYLLAPMEGVTEPCFRELLLRRNPPDRLGGVFTDFLRVVRSPVSPEKILRHLGPRHDPRPTGLQLLGADPARMAETARRAEEAGAPLVDVNLGCPAKGALRGRAGSALLDDPEAVRELVGAVAGAVRRIPVSAKIRAGGADDRRLEELARAVEAGGASLLTVHCRTRAEGYRGAGDWERLRRAAAAVSIPVCGNGGVSTHEDLERLRGETGCTFAMVGRAALGDPWIFGGRRASRAEAAGFLLEYAEELGRRGTPPQGAAGCVKELLHHWKAGGLVSEAPDSPDARVRWLCKDARHLRERLERIRDEGP